MIVTEASKVFDIPRQTLSDRINGKYTGRRTKLTQDEEKILVDYCMLMAKKCSHPLTVTLIKAFTSWAMVRKSSRPSMFYPTNGPS